MTESKKAKVLVTGANGFVGSRICRRLLDENYDLFAGIREGCDVSNLDNLDIQYRFGDITASDSLSEYLEGIDIVIHNAGIVKANSSEQFFKVNEKGTANLLSAAVNSQSIKKFIYISSLAAVGPSTKDKPLTENCEPHPVTTYGRSKLAGEKIVGKYSDKIQTVILRPAGVYGPGDKEILTLFETLNNRIKPYIGSFKRRLQLVHVDDLAQAVSKAVAVDTEIDATYFIAEESSYSYSEMIGILRKSVGRVSLPIYIPGWLLRLIAMISETVMRMFGKVPMLTTEKTNELLANWEVSIKKAQDDLGYEPHYDFKTGAKETVHWYRSEGWL